MIYVEGKKKGRGDQKLHGKEWQRKIWNLCILLKTWLKTKWHKEKGFMWPTSSSLKFCCCCCYCCCLSSLWTIPSLVLENVVICPMVGGACGSWSLYVPWSSPVPAHDLLYGLVRCAVHVNKPSILVGMYCIIFRFPNLDCDY